MQVDTAAPAKSPPMASAVASTPGEGGGAATETALPENGKAQAAAASQIMDMVASVRENLSAMNKVGLQFAVHESSGRMKVTVIDEDTGKVIREIPSDEVLNLAAKLDEMIGMIFDQKG